MTPRVIAGVAHAGIPIYTKKQLRSVPVEMGQRYAVRLASKHVRGPYEVAWMSDCGRAYRTVAVTDVADFPYAAPLEVESE